jgi:hypothetical protein
MSSTLHHSLFAIALITLLELPVIVRILLRPHRDPASRIAWVVVVGVLPLWGILAYLLLGEVNIGRRRVERLHAILKRMPRIPGQAAGDTTEFAAAVRRALPASFLARPFDQRVRSREWQYRMPSAELQRHDRGDGGRH